MICALDVHGHTHGRGVRYQWMHRMISRHDNAGSDRLFPKVILKNLFLDTFHHVMSKKANHCQIHTCIHQPERISCSNNTIERRQILESTTNNLNIGMRTKLPTEDVAGFLISIYKDQSHSHKRSFNAR